MEKPQDGMAFTESTSGTQKAEESAIAYSKQQKSLLPPPLQNKSKTIISKTKRIIFDTQ